MMTAATQQQKPLGKLLAIDDRQLASIQVSGIELDSRKIKSGDVFLACKGYAVDGRDYIAGAIESGAVAILAERDESSRWQQLSPPSDVPVIEVDHLSSQLSRIAGNFFDHPSKKLSLIGVTGTNGKTSCTHLIMQLLNRVEKSCGVMGTLGTGVDGVFSPTNNTTPDAVSIQRLLSQWRDENVSAAAMEISSHGLVQGRVSALNFDVAVFTNLTHDHLDYHGSMQAYAEAKTLLFQQPELKYAVINAADDFSHALINVIPDDVEILTYSANPDEEGLADVRVGNVHYHSGGVNCDLYTPWGKFELASPLIGDFNLSNVLAVISSLAVLGYPVAQLIADLPTVSAIDGRMEKVPNDTGVSVIIDYAHTPDALKKALIALKPHVVGDLWCVFGCGGDRDQGKRPQMGAIAERFASHCVVTNDNPRSESPANIIDQILSGMNSPALVEEDRAAAIELAIVKAAAGDCVLIAGKGHEQYQQIGRQRIEFSDIKQARLSLVERQSIMGVRR